MAKYNVKKATLVPVWRTLNFTNFRKRCAAQVGWNKKTNIKWITILVVSFSLCRMSSFPPSFRSSPDSTINISLLQRVDLPHTEGLVSNCCFSQNCHVLACNDRWMWAQEVPLMNGFGDHCHQYITPDNNCPADEKTLQKALSLLVNRSLESHNVIFILVLDRKQQFVFL